MNKIIMSKNFKLFIVMIPVLHLFNIYFHNPSK